MDASDPDLDLLTRRIGASLFSDARRPDAATESWTDRLLMNVGMRDETLKAQLFRFVDVLPSLNAPSQINRHLREYLGSVADRLPMHIGALSRFLPGGGIIGNRIASLALGSARRMARRFIAGSSLPEAIVAIQSLRERQLAFTIDLLGEAVLSESEALRYQGEYLSLIEGLADAAPQWTDISQIDVDDHGVAVPRVNVSVKLSSLYSQFDPIDIVGTSAVVRERLRPILRLARVRKAFVNIDMEQHASKEATLRIFQEVFQEAEFRDWPDVGIAIQAYLRSSGDDLQRLASWVRRRGTPIWVRLVKGAYWDYETVVAAQNGWPLPVFDHKAQTDANYEAQTAFLMSHHELLRPAIASHNIRSIANALALAERNGLAPRSFEFQMLYGMADPIKAALVKRGHRVRVYTPYGQLLPGMAYLVRRLLENTSNESFLRAGFLDRVPEEQLLMNPLERLSRLFGQNGHATQQSPDTGAFRNEPLADFAQETNRESMTAAIENLKPFLGATYPLVIGGQKIAAGKSIESSNPSHRARIVGRASSAEVSHAVNAIASAKESFVAWRDTSPRERCDLLLRCAQILRRRRSELAAWEVYETGKPWREADADVAEAIDYCGYYAREMSRLSTPQHRDVPGESNEYFYEPRGVAVIIAPWNFPLAILCGMTTAAIVAGNTAIMKPAEQSPVIAAKLMEVFEEAGLPAGVVNYLPGVGETVGPTLVSHPDVALIAFTGSREVGLAIQREASEVRDGQNHIKRVITELGGKNAVIVDDDADLDEAVHGVVQSAFGYAGQKCSACSRVIVLENVHDAFLSRLIEATRSLKIGHAEDPGTFVCPVIDDEARARIMAAIETAKGEARLVFAGALGALSEEGSFVAPHIFADVPPDSNLAQEEIFGPVLAVLRAGDLDEALRIANGTRYALTGGVFSRSPATIARVKREFRVGNLYVNRKITGALADRQPFGGFKLSGVGSKAGGPDYLQQFMVARTITENTVRRGFAPQGKSEVAAQPAEE